MSESVELYIKEVNIENVIAYVFKCPLCHKAVLARTYYEAKKNGTRHLNHCRKLLVQVEGRA